MPKGIVTNRTELKITTDDDSAKAHVCVVLFKNSK